MRKQARRVLGGIGVALCIFLSADRDRALAQKQPPPDLSGGGTPLGADIRFVHGDPKGRFGSVALTGEITKASVARFAEVIGAVRPRFEVLEITLNSRGGDVLAALQIGEIAREQWLMTTVDDDTPGIECASACVLVFAGGAVRIAGDDSRVGIHRPHFDPQLFASLDRTQAQKKYGDLADQVRTYLSKMGESDALYQAMMRVSSAEIRWLTYSEMKAMNLVGQDPAYAEWLRARNIARYGQAAVEKFDAWLTRQHAYVDRCAQTRPRSEDYMTARIACDTIFQRTDPNPLPIPKD
jgi:hypothetical protein